MTETKPKNVALQELIDEGIITEQVAMHYNAVDLLLFHLFNKEKVEITDTSKCFWTSPDVGTPEPKRVGRWVVKVPDDFPIKEYMFTDCCLPDEALYFHESQTGARMVLTSVDVGGVLPLLREISLSKKLLNFEVRQYIGDDFNRYDLWSIKDCTLQYISVDTLDYKSPDLHKIRLQFETSIDNIEIKTVVPDPE
jgi:hypothetical protein